VDQIRRAAPLTREWMKGGNPPPLMLGRAEWRSSADVFPLEYSDIREAHLLLAGQDPFVDLSIRREHLRLQVEHELRSKKIQLREGYLVGSESAEDLGQLLLRALPSFLTLFRAMLRLADQPVPREAAEQITALSRLAGFVPEPMLDVLRARAEPAAFKPPLNGALPEGFLVAVERAVSWLDQLKTRNGHAETV
jgi:hypothetical protein